jgi:hypothetical protein
MTDAIRRLPTSKVAGPNRILNEAIKAVLEAIATLLANAVTICLLKGKLLECCKEIIIVVL